MSDVEKRLTQQRAMSIAACAAAFAVGGPLIGHRFEIQKSDEAYRAEAARLATLLASSETDWRQTAGLDEAESGFVKASFTNYTGEAQPSLTDELRLVPTRVRDLEAISSFISFTPGNFGEAEQKKSELDCLSQAIYYEARSEDTRGQLAVAEVVMNRVRDSRYPNTVCDVVFQGRYRQTGCQFTFTCDGSLHVKPRGAAWDRARAVALHIQMGLSKPLTNEATHYHTDYVNPYWSAGLVVTDVIGTHIFYRFPKTGAEWTHARLALEAQNEHRQVVRALDAESLAMEALKVYESGDPELAAPAHEPVGGVIAISASADAPEAPPANRGREL